MRRAPYLSHLLALKKPTTSTLFRQLEGTVIAISIPSRLMSECGREIVGAMSMRLDGCWWRS
jgi:hypothetical protein